MCFYFLIFRHHVYNLRYSTFEFLFHFIFEASLNYAGTDYKDFISLFITVLLSTVVQLHECDRKWEILKKTKE